MTRTRIALTLTTVGLAGLLGLTAACGTPAGPAPAANADAGTDLHDEADALALVGLQVEAEPAPARSAGARAEDGTLRPGPARKLLRRNTLHGEVTLQTKNGVTTVAAQRGTVTAVDAAGLSVKSTDGFTATWSFGDKVRIVKDKQRVERTAVAVGAQVGVAGAKDGDKGTARLIILQ